MLEENIDYVHDLEEQNTLLPKCCKGEWGRKRSKKPDCITTKMILSVHMLRENKQATLNGGRYHTAVNKQSLL